MSHYNNRQYPGNACNLPSFPNASSLFHSWITKQHSTCLKLRLPNPIRAAIFNTGTWVLMSEVCFTDSDWYYIFSRWRALSMVLIEKSSCFSSPSIGYLCWKCTWLSLLTRGACVRHHGLAPEYPSDALHEYNLHNEPGKKRVLEYTCLSTFKNVAALTESCLFQWRNEQSSSLPPFRLLLGALPQISVMEGIHPVHTESIKHLLYIPMLIKLAHLTYLTALEEIFFPSLPMTMKD